MHWKALKYAGTGLGFAMLSITVFRHFGVSSQTITAVSYLFLAMGVVIAVIEEFRPDLDGSILGRIVLVSEGEDMMLKRVFTGEKYEIKGEVEKVQ
jgi:hypothetical protein